MDRHKALNDSLNDSCQKSKLTSWTRHVNQRGTVYTIRFDESTAILDPNDPDKSNQAQKVTYKPKSQYHVNRDFMKMREFKSSNRFDRQADNYCFGDISYISDMYHSAPVSTENTQDCQADSTHDSLLCSDACHHVMPHDFITHAISGEKLKIHHASESIHPPVEYESIEIIEPLVQFEATEQQHTDKLYYAESHSPCLQPTAEITHVSDDVVSEFSSDSYSRIDLEYNPASDAEDFSFGSPSDLQKYFQSNTTPVDDFVPPVGYVAKSLSKTDILCNYCDATVPKDTNMSFCDTCLLHICGHCMIINSHSHSIDCHGLFRYMSETEMHLQYVPDSKDNSTISDSSRPPESVDQKVPQLETTASFIENLLAEDRAKTKEMLTNVIGDSFDRYYERSSTSTHSGK